MESNAINDVSIERERQDTKWGEQNHSNEKWFLILTEELGEVAKAILEQTHDDIREEMIQVAAVAVAWVEAIDRANRVTKGTNGTGR